MAQSKAKKKNKKKINPHSQKAKPKQVKAVRLSQCMIVKNEENNIRRALSWGKGVVCEQIVVDTGSVDRTMEIAESMGAKVFQFEWNEDFAAAKNYAIEQATGDWIAFLDADEYFQEQDVRSLMELLEQADRDKNLDVLRLNMAHLKQDGSITATFFQDRIFRNQQRIRYQNRIHEQLCSLNGKDLTGYQVRNEIMILHTGYAENVNKSEKGERNARLLERELLEHPEDAALLMYLGDAYNMTEDRLRALDCYKKVIWEMDPERIEKMIFVRAALQTIRMTGELLPEKAPETIADIKDRLESLGYDDHPDIDYFQAVQMAKAGKLEKAAMLCERALNKLLQYTGAEVCSIAGNLELPNRIIAMAAFKNHDMQKAVSYAVNALRADKYSPDAINTLLQAFLSEFKPGMSPDPYWQFLCKLYDPANMKDIIFLHQFAGSNGFAALQVRILETLPPEVRAHIEVAGA